jgi:hypothetical protein
LIEVKQMLRGVCLCRGRGVTGQRF